MTSLAPPTALGRAAAAVRPFRVGGRTQLLVVVKASFRIVQRGPLAPLPPTPVVAHDVYSSSDPHAPLAAASEMAPYLPHADVLLTGHACARGRVAAPSVAVRLCVGLGQRVLLDKTLHVYGDRSAQGQGAPQPFLTMPLGYERALGGSADPDNPAGADPRAGRLPNLIDPRSPGRAAGFGPIPLHWPSRARRLQGADPSALLAPWPVIPSGFDWASLQAAPPDQQTPHLRGSEWIVLEGFHPDVPRFEATLPGPIAEARIVLPGAPEPAPVPLVADMLILDTDHLVGSLVWRGSAPLPDEAAIHGARVTARVALPGEDVPWDTGDRSLPFRASSHPPSPRPSHPTGLPFSQSPSAPVAPAGQPLTQAPSAPVAPAGLPFSQSPSAPVAPAGLPFAQPPSPAAAPAGLPFSQSPSPPPATEPASPWASGSSGVRSSSRPPPAQSASPWASGSPHVEPPSPPPATEPASPWASGSSRVEPSSPPPAAEPVSPWASGAARPSYAVSASPQVPVTAPVVPTNSPLAASPARATLPRAARAPRPRFLPEERPRCAPLVPPRQRRPAKVAAGGLGDAFLRSTAPEPPSPHDTSAPGEG